MALPTRLARVLASEPFDLMTRDFDTIMQRLVGREGPFLGSTYAVDIWETKDHLFVEAELPGFDRDQIDVTLENSVLTITAERKEENKDEHRDWLLNERRAVRFQRSFTLPPTVDDAKVQAKYENGVLSIRLNKREESKPKKITVS